MRKNVGRKNQSRVMTLKLSGLTGTNMMTFKMSGLTKMKVIRGYKMMHNKSDNIRNFFSDIPNLFPDCRD